MGDTQKPAAMLPVASEIRDYCETDVVNTYLVFLRFQLMRGVLDKAGYEAEITFVRETLGRLEAA